MLIRVCFVNRIVLVSTGHFGECRVDALAYWFRSRVHGRCVDLDSNPGEGLVVCKCIVLSRHGGTPNSRRASSPRVKLVEENDRWKAPVT
ncbi:hypothetical protein TNCV_4618891 [Trichonephila clavipes]|nr:hypothetical protein TNCV_4618891 [Trichonephila clavipes]